MASAPRFATRCPACQSAFRVVADQLRLRDGLVRCGHCNHVFDGREHLAKLGAPPAATPRPADPAPAVPADHDARTTPAREARIAETNAGESAAPADPPAQAEAAPAAGSPPPSDRAGIRWRPHRVGPHPRLATRPKPEPDRHAESAATLDILRAAPAHHASKPRAMLARMAIGLLVASAFAQYLFLSRAPIAHHVPAARALWARLCQTLSCDVPPPRDLDALQIESSSMQHQENGADGHYVLSATLRNRTGDPVALPAIELVTTDLQDQLLVRRALLPDDYLDPADASLGRLGLPARAELPIQVRFRSRRPTANYRVLIFYP